MIIIQGTIFRQLTTKSFPHTSWQGSLRLAVQRVCRPSLTNRSSLNYFSITAQNYNKSKVEPKVSIPEPKVSIPLPIKNSSNPPLKPGINSVLLESFYTIPNILTMSRLAVTPAIGYYIMNHQTWPAMIMFAYASITDFLDGFIARRYNLKSILGTILDPIADKLLMGTCTIALYIGGVMPFPLLLLFCGKDFMLLLMGLYYRYITLPPPKTWSRLANLSIPTVKVEPNWISKVNTGMQMLYIANLVFIDQLSTVVNDFHYWLGSYEYLVGFTTLISAVSYLLPNKSMTRL